MRSPVVAAGAALLLAAALWTIADHRASAAPAEQATVSPSTTHWAFRAPVSRISRVLNAPWVRNPIDAFVLERLQKEGIAPAAEAPKAALIRRAYLDLIGLPPTPKEVEQFLADESPDAYDQLVDRLLASPQYGERWARHWLDLARFAESEGFKADETRPNAWRYRDYVIQSFNEDKPYDRFVREQIAGDEIWPDDPNARVATYFLRGYPDESNARELFQRRQELLNDITDTTGAVFLGLTMGCARCHDHKYDPIPQRDYYRLQAFFADVRADDNFPIASREQVREHDAKLAVWKEKTQAIRDEMARLEEPKRQAILKDYFDKYPPEIQVALRKDPKDRTPMDWLLYHKAAQYMEPESYQYLAPSPACAAALKGDAKKRYAELKKELAEYDDLKPADLPVGTGVCDAGREAPPHYLLKRGVYNAPTVEVKPGFLSVIDPADPTITPPEGLNSTGRRTVLAHWLASPDNPLAARVMVNRVWQYHFGRGIVATPSDFGVKGEPPTQPELLDWLAVRFVKDGWSLKKLHRLIMTSATYRQSTAPNTAYAKIDPDDALLWRFPRKRLEAEVIRDSGLAIAGELNPKMGGPGGFPEIPAGMEVRGGWSVSKDEAERDRRSVYIFVRRNTRYPMLEAFDIPDPYESCPRRYMTTTPSQALTLLNNKLVLDWAQHFAGRVLADAGPDREALVRSAWRLAYSREPGSDEMETMCRFFDRQTAIVAERLAHGEKAALPLPPNDKLPAPDGAALVDLCHVLMNSNEFVYSD